MAYNPYYFDLTEPITAVYLDDDHGTLINMFNAWAAIQPIRPYGERATYQAEQKILKAWYRVWLEQAYPLESHLLLKWKGRYFEQISEPVQDTITPWQYVLIQEVQDDLSHYSET
jgi:hypothetical protein